MAVSRPSAYDTLADRVGDDAIVRVFESFYAVQGGGTPDPHVEIFGIESAGDGINYRFEAILTHGDRVYALSCADGNNNGSDILSWSDDTPPEIDAAHHRTLLAPHRTPRPLKR